MKIKLLVSQEWLAAVDALAERLHVERNAAVVNMVWTALYYASVMGDQVSVHRSPEERSGK